jgi:linoleoyl-CoA desaturase
MRTKSQVKFVDRNKSVFFPTLKKRVDEYFAANNLSKHADATMVIKTLVLLTMYILPFVLLIVTKPSTSISLLYWSIMGLGVAGIGMSVMHDANHGAYSSNKLANYIFGNTLNLLGASSFNWKLQHNILHHTYTNVTHIDEDIQDRLVLKFSPHTKVKSYHKYQWMYAFLFYGLLTLYWVVAKDFVQFVGFTKTGVNTNNRKQNISTLTRIVLMKLIYFSVILVLPIAVFNISAGQVIGGFLLMHFIAGNILTIVFQLAHTVDETSHPLPNESGIIENDWAIHQLNTTVNFSKDNKLISWYVGGLNYQIEHHLFPRISHIHYPAIANIVKQTAQEYGIPYLENRTFLDALKSHITALKKFGRLPNLNEAIG